MVRCVEEHQLQEEEELAAVRTKHLALLVRDFFFFFITVEPRVE
jgi:hypothetical protein